MAISSPNTSAMKPSWNYGDSALYFPWFTASADRSTMIAFLARIDRLTLRLHAGQARTEARALPDELLNALSP
jgi:hypothetical protein